MSNTEPSDPDFAILAGLSETLRGDYEGEEPDPWEGSPFAWILRRPSRQKGAIGERLVAGWCAARDFDVVRSPDSEADRIIEGHRVEIKFSTLWSSGGFKFQQVRDQDYEQLFCLGLSPRRVQAWLVPKEALYRHVIGVTGQHTGAGGTDTAWIGFQANNPPRWIREFGGTLAGVHAVLTGLGRGRN